MPDVKVYRHGDRWAVAEIRRGVARQGVPDARRRRGRRAKAPADGGTLEVVDEDGDVGAETRPEPREEDPPSLRDAQPDDALETQRSVQPGL